MVNDKVIHSVLLENEDVKISGNELLKLALEAGGKDNITLQLIKVTKSNYKDSVFIDKSNRPASKKNIEENTAVDIERPVRDDQLTQESGSSINRIFQKWKTLLFIAVVALLAALYVLMGKSRTEETEQVETDTSKVYQIIGLKHNDSASYVRSFSDSINLIKFCQDKIETLPSTIDSTEKIGYVIDTDSGYLNVKVLLGLDTLPFSELRLEENKPDVTLEQASTDTASDNPKLDIKDEEDDK